MKTTKTIFTFAFALAITGFATAQNTNGGKRYTAAQINRAATTSPAQKEQAKKFEETPAATVVLQTNATPTTNNTAATNTTQKQATGMPETKTALKYADQDRLAAERSHQAVSPQAPGNSSVSPSKK